LGAAEECAPLPALAPCPYFALLLAHSLNPFRLWGTLAAVGLVVLMARFPDEAAEPAGKKA